MQFLYCLLRLALVSASVIDVAKKSYDCGGAACVNAAKLLQDQCGERGVSDPKCACGMSDAYFVQLHECSKDCKGLQIEGYTGPNDYKKAYCLQASQDNYLPVSAAALGTTTLASKSAAPPPPPPATPAPAPTPSTTSKPKPTITKSVTKTSTTGKAAAGGKTKAVTTTAKKGVPTGYANVTGAIPRAGGVSIDSGKAVIVTLLGLVAFLLF